MNLRCLWEHNYKLEDSQCGVFRCTRCNRISDFFEEDYDTGTLDIPIRWHIAKRRLFCWIERKTKFFRKCSDCGQRWNKHTDQCPPF